MTTEMECLDNIRKNLQNAIVNLYEANKWINEREHDYYHNCVGFMKAIHQIENLYGQYDYLYLKEAEGKV